MVDKTKYRDLVRRIEELENELASTRRISGRQQSSERYYRLLLEHLGRIDRAIKQQTDMEHMLCSVLETVFDIFGCDRAWILYPCNPEAASYRVPVELTRPGYPGSKSANLEVRMTPVMAQAMREALASDIPLMYGKDTSAPGATSGTGISGVESEMLLAIQPRTGNPWLLGLHQCSNARVWTNEEQNLFNEIGGRISDGLSILLTLRKLKENEQQLKGMFEQAAVGVALCDSNTGQFVKVNKKFSDIVDYSIGELCRLTFQDITHPDDIHKHLDDFKLLVESKIEDFTLDKRYLRKDGAFVWGRISVSPMWKKGETPDYHIVIFQDITEQKKTENKLKTSEIKYKDIFNNLLNVYIETNLDGTILEISPSAEEMSGFKREELIGTQVLDYYADKKKEINCLTFYSQRDL